MGMDKNNCDLAQPDVVHNVREEQARQQQAKAPDSRHPTRSISVPISLILSPTAAGIATTRALIW
jgi:hypothetical protein